MIKERNELDEKSKIEKIGSKDRLTIVHLWSTNNQRNSKTSSKIKDKSEKLKIDKQLNPIVIASNNNSKNLMISKRKLFNSKELCLNATGVLL